MLSTVLFEEYPVFAYDRARVIAAQERAERILEHLDAFAELYRQAWRPQLPADEFEAILAGRAEAFIADNVKTERDLWSIARLRQRTEAVLEYNTTIRQANNRRQSTQRAMLYHRLFTVWLDHFDRAKLTYSRIAKKPSGPLVDFILRALQEIRPAIRLPSREAVRDNIDRECNARAEVRRQVTLLLRKRRAVGV